MRIAGTVQMLRKNPRRGLWHMKYDLQFIVIRSIQIRIQIWINLQEIWRFKGTINKFVESSIYTGRNTIGGVPHM